MKRFKNIVCVVDAGTANEMALRHAVALAENNQASLAVVEVATDTEAGIGMTERDGSSADLQADLLDARTRRLESLLQPHRGRVELQAKVLVGSPSLEIVREVLRNGHDLVIKVPERQDWLDRLLGSDDMRLLRKCPCPVYLIKPRAPKSHRCILAAVDVDHADIPKVIETRRALNLQVLELATSLALSESAELHVAHAWEAVAESFMGRGAAQTTEVERQRYVEEVRRQHAANLAGLMDDVAAYVGKEALDYLEPRIHLIRGWPRQEIPALARELDVHLIVMGTVARTGIAGWFMGNTAETILSQIDCSVLAVKPPGFVTPVALE